MYGTLLVVQFCLLVAEMIGAGASMATHNNCIYVFGGMDEERAEHMFLYRWDLSSDVGFELITYRSLKCILLVLLDLQHNIWHMLPTQQTNRQCSYVCWYQLHMLKKCLILHAAAAIFHLMQHKPCPCLMRL